MPRPRSDIAPRIVRAARERFLTDGVDGASLRRIAQDAKTSIGMIYYYFPTKDDLFLSVLEDVYPALLDDVAAALALDAPFEERLARVSARLGRVSEEELSVLRIVVREALVSSERRRRVLERFSVGHIGLLLRTVAEGVQRGELSDRVPLPVVTMLVGLGAMVPQLLRRLVGEHFPAAIGMMPDANSLAPALADLLMHGVAAPPATVTGEDDDSNAKAGKKSK